MKLHLAKVTAVIDRCPVHALWAGAKFLWQSHGFVRPIYPAHNSFSACLLGRATIGVPDVIIATKFEDDHPTKQ